MSTTHLGVGGNDHFYRAFVVDAVSDLLMLSCTSLPASVTVFAGGVGRTGDFYRAVGGGGEADRFGPTGSDLVRAGPSWRRQQDSFTPGMESDVHLVQPGQTSVQAGPTWVRAGPTWIQAGLSWSNMGPSWSELV